MSALAELSNFDTSGWDISTDRKVSEIFAWMALSCAACDAHPTSL